MAELARRRTTRLQPHRPTYDIVLLGATGFTGELTAAYLAEHAPADCRWALAGRNQAKLEAVRDRLAATDPVLADLPAAASPTATTPRRCGRWPSPRAWSSPPSAPTWSTASRWSPPAPPPAPTTSTSPVSRSSSTGCTSPTTRPPSRTRRPDRALLRLRLDPARPRRALHRQAAARPASRSRCAAWSAPSGDLLRRHLPLGARRRSPAAGRCRRPRRSAAGRAAPGGPPRPRRRPASRRRATPSSATG